jgi:hypothetical protein
MVAGSAVQNLVHLDEHQQLLMAASDMLIEIYTESTILRTEKLAKNQGEDKVGKLQQWQNYTCIKR